jgi:deoxyribodipyrimidine photo-lyase
VTDARPVLLWFREDLRLADNPALHAALATRQPLICVYIFDTESDGLRPPGGAARWWLHGALAALDTSLRKRRGALHILRGAAAPTIERLAIANDVSAVFWNRRYDAAGRGIDAAIKSALKVRGVNAESFNAALLHEPWIIAGKTGAPFRVFTPFWRATRAKGEPEAPLGAPDALDFHPQPEVPGAIALADLNLEPHKPDWAAGLRASWTPGEAGAQAALEHFLHNGLAGYAGNRDRPDMASTSRLSPALHFGHLSPRQIWHAAQTAVASGASNASRADLDKFFAELGWREFSYHLLFHHPDLATRNFQRRFDTIPWHDDAEALRAWQRGLTGYPIVDAGMRELWATGWMHNRVRMVAASFLVKHLLIDWRAGERWFWDTLIDADAASNAASWQWVAGSGADAAPYFRIFNPVLQGEKFDPDGAYVRRWVPELAELPASLIHKPWKASAGELAAADVHLGQTYPKPIVEHEAARQRALAAFSAI